MLDNRFEISLPEDWRDASRYMIQGPEEQGIRHHVMVNIEEPLDIADLTDFTEHKLAELRAELPGYEDLNRDYFQTRGGLPACKAVYKCLLGGEIEVYQWVLLVLAGKTGYTLTTTFSRETALVWGEKMDEMFTSFNVPGTSPSGNGGRRTVKVLTNRFSVNLPPLWRDASVHMFEGPVEEGFRHDIDVGISNHVDTDDIQTYAQLNIRALERNLQGYQELKRGPYRFDAPIPAYELVYKWRPLEDHKYYCKNVFALYNRTGYALSVKFTKRSWKIHGSRMDAILRTFAIPGIAAGIQRHQEPK